jgi:hypothetical protein
VKTWPEPVSTKEKDCGDCSNCFLIRANQSWRKARKTRMAMEEADEFIKKLELMPIPESEESSEEESGGWRYLRAGGMLGRRGLGRKCVWWRKPPRR